LMLEILAKALREDLVPTDTELCQNKIRATRADVIHFPESLKRNLYRKNV
jgi:hypothetical protein